MNSILKMIFLYSDIYSILVIICNTSVGNWGHIIFPSLLILFPWFNGMSQPWNKIFYFNNNKNTRKDNETFKISLMRK